MKKTEDFSLEGKLEEIRKTLDLMQKGISDFDKQTELFRQGKKLIHECRKYLDGAEAEVKKLVDGEWEDFSPE